MGRTAIIFGATDGRACGVDRSGGGVLETEAGRGKDPSLDVARAGAVLPRAEVGEETPTWEGEASGEAEVILPLLWRELPLAERQRFGHCFSFLVLKALSFRACCVEDVEEVEP